MEVENLAGLSILVIEGNIIFHTASGLAGNPRGLLAPTRIFQSVLGHRRI